MTKLSKIEILRLSQTQHQQVRQIADGLITIDGDKNLSNLARHFGGGLSPKTAAYTLREASWTADNLRIPLRKHPVKTAFQLANVQDTTRYVFLSIDDSFSEKDR